MNDPSTVYNTTDGILEPLAEIEDVLTQIQAGKFLFLAASTILFWDHACTLSEEVHGVWKKRKNYILWIFLFVRYYAPLAMIVVYYGFFSTTINRSRCEKWMHFATLGVSTPLMISAGVLMMFRVWALYNRNKLIIFVLSSFLAAQTAIGIWQWTEHGGTPAPDPLDNYEYHFCIYLPPKTRRSSTIYLFMELAFDTLVFVLTICRTTYMHLTNLPAMMGEKSCSLVDNLITDGALYFAAIFSINLAWVIMILHAPTNLRAVLAVPSSCLTTVLISRITLNLRMTVYGPARVSRRTYNDIILSDFETRSSFDPPSKADVSMSMASADQSLGSVASDDDSGHASGHVKSEMAWMPWNESKGDEESARKSGSSASSSDEDEDDVSRDRSIVDHDVVREVPRGRNPEGVGGSS